MYVCERERDYPCILYFRGTFIASNAAQDKRDQRTRKQSENNSPHVRKPLDMFHSAMPFLNYHMLTALVIEHYR